jgi:ACS family tartrate transporter-like MFS transporter
MVGFVKDATGSFQGGLIFLAALLVAGAIATLLLRRASALRL